ncbi:NAD(P)/FAD-dependent oxidoreductase [Benzoatithermus flavus]|uniref:FAD-binding oxidoreductase n=1 Tax=Benzoatithermus flavus TaxID=3108223 RepID=A0ABU8XPU7_9PROT
MALPEGVKYLVIGAGVHGLSTAYHLALQLKARGLGDGSDILVVDKTGIAAGASGIACGVVRNNYYQPAMRELMAHCVTIWEQHAELLSYHPVGYMQISPECMREQVATIYEQERAIGYPSVFIEGAEACDRYMKAMLEDWSARGITSVLHEKKGGYANNTKSVYGLATLAESQGVRIVSGLKVVGFERANGSSGAVAAVLTERGRIACEQVIVGVGPWVKQIWDMLELPKTVTIQGRDGRMHEGVRMWTYWSLQEGTLGVDPDLQRTNSGGMPPVIHVDTDAPLYSDVDGSLITDKLWGIYYKPDFHFGGIQGGAMPYRVETDPDLVQVDPYGPESPDFVVGDDFAHMWCSALAHCQKRFSGQIGKYKKEPSGGIGCFTPDNFPVFDRFCENVYIIADSNHGYKMIGVGDLVARELVGERSRLLEPFRFSRYAEGKLHPVSNSPFPWS